LNRDVLREEVERKIRACSKVEKNPQTHRGGKKGGRIGIIEGGERQALRTASASRCYKNRWEKSRPGND